MNEKARLGYLDWQERYLFEKPFQLFMPINDAHVQRTNLVFEHGEPETIHDIRGDETNFTLDFNGFEYCNNSTSMKNSDSIQKIEEIYLPEVESLIRDRINDVEEVYFFDWRVCWLQDN